MSRSGQKSTVKRPGSPSGQNLGNLGRPDPVRAKIHRKLKKLSGLAPRKIGILGSALYRDIHGSSYSPQLMHSGPATGKGKVRASPSPEPVRTQSPHGLPGTGQPSATMMHSHMAMLDGLTQTVAAIHHQTM